ncbi:MAG: hypothetical protein ABSF22_16370 [Bryobacteraceae bacterium]
MSISPRFLSLVLLLVPAALPAAVTYTYTGNHFNTILFGTTYTTSDSVSITLTFNTALAANLAFSSVTPVSFAISDGIHTLTSSSYDPTVTGFQVGTNASRAINMEYFSHQRGGYRPNQELQLIQQRVRPGS